MYQHYKYFFEDQVVGIYRIIKLFCCVRGLAVLQHGDNHRQLDMNSYCFSSGNAITIDPGHFAGNIDIVSGTFVHMHKLHKWLL